MKNEKLILMLKYIIEFLYWFYKKFLTDDEAFDEVVKDPRDYKLSGDFGETKPNQFKYDVLRYINQNKTWYKSSCTAQATTEASNTIRKYKSDQVINSWFDLWDIMKSLWLWAEKQWAYLINAVKQAIKENYIQWYYKVSWVEEIKKSLYRTNLVVTWTSKIDWNLLKKTWYIVSEISWWYGHAFYIKGWDDEKQHIICANSYWTEYGDKWDFYIPYNLVEQWILFNSTYWLIVNPEWTKTSREELFKKYQLTR